MVSFKIDEPLPSLNDYINRLKSPYGKQRGAQLKRDIDGICECYMLPVIRQAKEICKRPVLILFRWEEKTHRRDLDNVSSAKKFILDGMQKCGILENDNYTHIRGIYDTFVYGEKTFVEVEIYSLDECDKVLNRLTLSERLRLMPEIEKEEKRRKYENIRS